MKTITVPVYFKPLNSEDLEAIYGDVPLAMCDIIDVDFTKIPHAFKADSEEFNGEKIRFTVMYLDGFRYCTPVRKDRLISMFNVLEK